MARYYEYKKRSPISSQEILRAQASIVRLNKKIEKIRSECKHKFEVLGSGDGWDEYSWVDCEVEEHIHCIICGLDKYRKTGKINHH